MSESSRALPDRPSLRFLKLEAKRRLAKAEFGTLHEAQLAIAREHGFPSWTALKNAINPETTALPHVRWLIDRFRDAENWSPPSDAELGEHLTERFLRMVPADILTKQLRSVAAKLREELTVDASTDDTVRVEIAGLRIEASAEDEPPHRLRGLRIYPIAKRLTDTRLHNPTTRTTGDAPQRAQDIAEQSMAELGLPGLILAGSPEWTVTRGWADLGRREELRPDHRFPAYGVAKLITAVTVLTVVDDIDRRANELLRGPRLADDDITVRDLLTHTAGVVGPETQFAPEAPEFAYHDTTIPCSDRRGEFMPGNGGYAVLGKIIADVTGVAYPDAVRNRVFEPLGMADSDFPARWPGGAVVTGYHLADDGTFEEAERHVSTTAAAGGLWTTAPDLVRFGRSWTSLLTRELTEEALRPQAGPPGAAQLGLGWLVNPAKAVCGHSGVGPGAGVSLIISMDTGAVTVAAANRLVPIEPVNARLCRPIA